MKKIFITLMLTVSGYLAISQQSDVLSADVNGSYVTLNDVGSYRNCGASYEMIMTKQGYEINWLQNDTGLCALCYCNFDLSVEIGPLSAGSYNTEVYYTESYNQDTFYVGHIQFEILVPSREDSLGVVSTSQSNCYHISGLDDNETKLIYIRCYPNPAEVSTAFKCYVNWKSRITILNLLGQNVKDFILPYSGDYDIKWNLSDRSGQRLTSGMYFYVLESGKEKITGKLMIR